MTIEPTEHQLQRAIVYLLQQLGAVVIRLNAGRVRGVQLAPPGTPDLLAVLKDGRVLWIECKAKTGELRAAQVAMHTTLRAYGQQVIIAHNVADVIAVIEGTPRRTVQC